MGGESFMFTAEGSDLKKVHADAVAKAHYEYGHAGYTGTIAEKPEVELRAPDRIFPAAEDAKAFAEHDLNNNDKWGPAFAVAYGTEGAIKGFVLYGWASS